MIVPRRLLVVRLSSIGDVLLTTPAARALREAFPQAHITWAVDSRCAPVVEGNPYLSEVVSIPRGGGAVKEMVRYWRTVRGLPPFDCVLDLHGLARSAIVTWAAGAPVRIGFAGTRELSHLAYTHTVPPAAGPMHRVDYYAEFLEALGIPVPHRVMLFPFSPEHEAEARALLEAEAPGSGPLVAMCVWAGHPQKCWPADRFAAVADRLTETHGHRVVVVGAKGDRPAVDAMKAAMRSRVTDLAGRIGLKVLAALLQSVDVFLSADTGPMHVAAAVGTPAVALFGPTDPALYHPHRVEHVVLRKSCRCLPHWRRPACRDRECMRAITVDEVEAAVVGLLERTRGRTPG